MKRPNLTKKTFNYAALAFFLPLAGLLILRLVCTLTFNGVYSMLYSDQYHQYFPFFLEFRRALLSGESLLFSWNVGMGMDYLGLISYYLASPLNLLTVLIPESWMLGYFSLLMPLKLSFAGLFFGIFLQKVFKKNDFSVTVFGCFYALCAWALGYHWNIMWLDTFALLPLVALGTIALLKDKKFILYTVTLFLSIAANYYIGLFTCIFVLLLFICYQICRWESFSKFFSDLVRIAAFSVIAIGMTAFLELPTLAALQTTQSSVNKFPEGFKLNITDDDTWLGLLDAMRQVAGNMNGGIEPTFKEGLPNLYCGVITNVLMFLYLTCKQVKLRDKICSVVLLLFFNVSFIIRQLDYIWHGFHFTNMIPYRFSFLYSFVMLYMAYTAWTLRKEFKNWQIAIAGILSLGLVCLSESLPAFIDLVSGKVTFLPWDNQANISSNMEKLAEHSTFVLYNVLFIAVYIATLLYERKCSEKTPVKKKGGAAVQKHSRAAVTSVLLCAMVVELVFNVVNFGVYFPGTNASNYPKGGEDSAMAIEYMKEREKDNLFFRAEVTHAQTLNDGALNGYNGISTFTSSANVRVTEFMKAFGYGAKNTYNRYCYEESTPVANLFLNLKYMIERDARVEPNAYFDTVHNFGNVYLLENNAYLPLGFMANVQLINMSFQQDVNEFIFQNDLMKTATGLSEDVWHLISGNYLTISSNGATINSQNPSGYSAYKTTGSTGTVTYSYTADRKGFMCIMLDLYKKNSYTIYHNGRELYSETYSLPQMVSVCDVVPGDVIEIKLKCKSDESGTINITGAILDETAFRKCYDYLASSTMEVTSFSNTRIEGVVKSDKAGVLYTSIPQDGNWIATVDGVPVNTVLIGNAMCGILLGKGEHNVCFIYNNQSFNIGLAVSIVSTLILLTLYVVVYKPKCVMEIIKKISKKK